MATQVQLRNEKTGEIKSIKVGWSWTLFFFSSIGIPLFMRKLYVWGALILFFWTLDFGIRVWEMSLANDGQTDLYQVADMLGNCFNVLLGIIGIFLAIKGNSMTGKNYLENGWVFADPDSNASQYAKSKWSLA